MSFRSRLVRPDGGFLQTGGGFRTKGGGFSAEVFGGLNWPATGAQLATAMGYASAPTAMWRGDSASTLTDLVGSVDLTASGTPTLIAGGNLEGAVELSPDNNSDFFTAASSASLSAGTGSFAVLMVAELLAVPGSDRYLMGTRAADTGNPGWNVFYDALGRLNFLVDDATSVDGELLTLGTAPTKMVYLAVRDTNADNVQAFVAGDVTASSTGGTNAASGDITSTQALHLGKGWVYTSPYVQIGLAAFWVGAAAEGVITATHAGNLATYIGL